MAAATRGRKTRFDDRPRAQIRSEADEQIGEGLEEWAGRRANA
jgi:hypothetical protein